MFNDVDETLRQLLIREIPIKNGEVEIAFDQPKREWSARLNRPTLNLFLYDVRENAKLRQSRPLWELQNDNGHVTKRRIPVRVDLNYMITAWATEPEDEHRLLARTLMGLFRTPELPDDLLAESLRDQPAPISLMVAQDDTLRNPAEVWSALDNEMKPTVPLVVTMALNPYKPLTGPLVRTRELRIGPSPLPLLQQLDPDGDPSYFWSIGGTLRSAKPLEEPRLVLVEEGLDIKLQPEGRFVIGNLKAGDYTLEVSAKDRKPRSYKITVPSADYDLEV
jgi:hypothetical protein